MNKLIFTLLATALPISAFCTEMDSVQKAALIDSLIKNIESHYVLVENTDSIARDLRSFSKAPEFSGSSDSYQVAELLSGELQKHDKHFAVQYLDEIETTSPNSHKEGWFDKLGRKNSGFNKVEILDGNVGYVDFWGFDLLNEKSRNTAAHVMGLLSDVDALIIDLRNNGGGSAEMVQFIASYFFAHKTHLNSFYSRQTGKTSEFWTFDNVKWRFPESLPVYILTSNNTFSAAEEFAYDFKHLKRATIVGEPTKGGANPWGYFELGGGFRAAIPNAKAINPITKTNWEGVGVKPDISVVSSEALDKAYTMALEKIIKRANNEYQRQEIVGQLNKLAGGNTVR